MTLAATGVVSCSAASTEPTIGVAQVSAPFEPSAGSTHVLSLQVTNPTVTHLALGDRYLAYTQAKSGVPQDFPNEVVAVDLATHRARVIARTAWRRGQSDWVVTDGDWVFWTDQSIAGADSPTGLRWTIRGADLRTGRRVVLARNTFDSPVPLPVAGAGKVLWAQQAAPDSSANTLQEYVIRAGRVKQLATLPAGQLPDQLAVGRRGNYYDAINAADRTSAVWRVAAEGGRPQRVTTTGTARAVAVDPGSAVIAWSNGPLTADPTSFTVATEAHPERAVRTVRSGIEYDLRVGRGFASYLTQSGTLRVVRLGDAKPVDIATDVAIPCRTSVSANRIAYCRQGATDGRITLTVDRVDG